MNGSSGRVAGPPVMRQIRFVSSDGQPHSKRRRIDAACRTCRKRKTRCSGEKPVCETCRLGGHQCLGFPPPVSHRPSISHDRNTRPPTASDDELLGLSRPDPESPDRQYSDDEYDQSGQAPPEATAARMYATPQPDEPQNTEADATIPPLPEAEDRKLPIDPEIRSSSVSRPGARLPYFRYFGPTAIVPGYKQVLGENRDTSKKSITAGSNRSGKSPVGQPSISTAIRYGTEGHSAPIANGVLASPRPGPKLPVPTQNSAAQSRRPNEHSRPHAHLPRYELRDPAPVNPLIISLVQTFFTYLGCNYPFLDRTRFLADVKAKMADPLLVNSVCAIAARFSKHSLFINGGYPETPAHEVLRSEYGDEYAKRAMASVVDTFTHPTLPAVQAALLLAYVEFGSGHDSGLWMYLGIAIRMAQDLGMHKLEALRRSSTDTANGLSTKAKKFAQLATSRRRGSTGHHTIIQRPDHDTEELQKEKRDTFWCILLLDRFISSGTGRPVTISDKDIEVAFPRADNSSSSQPDPFPVLIRIVYLYGRVSDLLNNIRETQSVTPELMQRLSNLEKEVTELYEIQVAPCLGFDPQHFKDAVNHGQGPNMILLHLWFHTLVILLHHPTVLISLGDRAQTLMPYSRELAVSSAKSITDILLMAESNHPASLLSNPFVSQPMYIAACTWLAESAANTATHPPTEQNSRRTSDDPAVDAPEGTEPDPLAQPERILTPPLPPLLPKKTKHRLLALNARQNYEHCYRMLESLEKYWSGAHYIVTVLDQKADGIPDPLMYREDELNDPDDEEDDQQQSAVYPFLSKLKTPQPNLENQSTSPNDQQPNTPFAWSLAGTTNSRKANITRMCPPTNVHPGTPQRHSVDPTGSTGIEPQPQQPQMIPSATHNGRNTSAGRPKAIHRASSHLSPRNVNSPAAHQLVAHQQYPTYPFGQSPLPQLPYNYPISADASSSHDTRSLGGLNSNFSTHDSPMMSMATPYDLSADGAPPRSDPNYFNRGGTATAYPVQNVPYGMEYIPQGQDFTFSSHAVDMNDYGPGTEPWMSEISSDFIHYFNKPPNGNNWQP